MILTSLPFHWCLPLLKLPPFPPRITYLCPMHALPIDLCTALVPVPWASSSSLFLPHVTLRGLVIDCSEPYSRSQIEQHQKERERKQNITVNVFLCPTWPFGNGFALYWRMSFFVALDNKEFYVHPCQITSLLDIPLQNPCLLMWSLTCCLVCPTSPPAVLPLT